MFGTRLTFLTRHILDTGLGKEATLMMLMLMNPIKVNNSTFGIFYMTKSAEFWDRVLIFPNLALQVLTLRTNIRNLKRINQKTDNKKDELAETSFANFTSSLEVEYQKMGLLNDGQPLRVNSFVEGFHDSLILYAFAIDAVSTLYV